MTRLCAWPGCPRPPVTTAPWPSLALCRKHAAMFGPSPVAVPGDTPDERQAAPRPVTEAATPR
jgi:hypothetical protein